MKLADLKAERDQLNAERNEHIEARSGHDKRAREIAKTLRHLDGEIIKAYERGERDGVAEEPHVWPSPSGNGPVEAPQHQRPATPLPATAPAEAPTPPAEPPQHSTAARRANAKSPLK